MQQLIHRVGCWHKSRVPMCGFQCQILCSGAEEYSVSPCARKHGANKPFLKSEAKRGGREQARQASPLKKVSSNSTPRFLTTTTRDSWHRDFNPHFLTRRTLARRIDQEPHQARDRLREFPFVTRIRPCYCLMNGLFDVPLRTY